VKYAIEKGSGAMIHVPCFIKIGSGIQKWLGGGDTQQGDLISLLLLYFLKIRKVGQENE
jgi:hypothetical protein